MLWWHKCARRQDNQASPFCQKRNHIYIVNLTTFELELKSNSVWIRRELFYKADAFCSSNFMCEYFKNYSETMEKGTLWKAHLSHEILIDSRMQLDRTYPSAMHKRTNKYFPFVCCWKTILSVWNKGSWMRCWYEWYLKRNEKPLWNHKRRSVESQIEVFIL